MSGRYNTGERRGMLVVIGILAIIVAGTFIFRNFYNNNNSTDQTDSIIRLLHSQIDSTNATSKNKKAQSKKKKKQTEKSSSKKYNNTNYEERNPLNEALPLIK